MKVFTTLCISIFLSIQLISQTKQERLDSHDIWMIGEHHVGGINLVHQLNLIKQASKLKDTVYFHWELPEVHCGMVNHFIKTGDEKVLETICRFPEQKDFYKVLKDLGNVKVLSFDFERISVIKRLFRYNYVEGSLFKEFIDENPKLLKLTKLRGESELSRSRMFKILEALPDILVDKYKGNYLITSLYKARENKIESFWNYKFKRRDQGMVDKLLKSIHKKNVHHVILTGGQHILEKNWLYDLLFQNHREIYDRIQPIMILAVDAVVIVGDTASGKVKEYPLWSNGLESCYLPE